MQNVKLQKLQPSDIRVVDVLNLVVQVGGKELSPQTDPETEVEREIIHYLRQIDRGNLVIAYFRSRTLTKLQIFSAIQHIVENHYLEGRVEQD